MSVLLLRAAEPVDAEDVAEVLVVSRKEFLPFAPSVHTDDEVLAWVCEVLLPTGGVTVAVSEGSVVGVLAVSRTEDASWVDQLYIHPGHVGRGSDRSFSRTPWPHHRVRSFYTLSNRTRRRADSSSDMAL